VRYASIDLSSATTQPKTHFDSSTTEGSKYNAPNLSTVKNSSIKKEPLAGQIASKFSQDSVRMNIREQLEAAARQPHTSREGFATIDYSNAEKALDLLGQTTQTQENSF
jgi:hypothetical protein